MDRHEGHGLEKTDKGGCSILAPLGVIAIAIVILLGNLGIISAHLTSILWPVLLGLTGLLKMVDCRRHYEAMCRHCACRKDRTLVVEKRDVFPPREGNP